MTSICDLNTICAEVNTNNGTRVTCRIMLPTKKMYACSMLPTLNYYIGTYIPDKRSIIYVIFLYSFNPGKYL